MTPEEITKLAEELAKDWIDATNLPNCLGNEVLSGMTKGMERVVHFILRTHCIVEKSNGKEVTIDGWVARDDEDVIGDSGLYLYPVKPVRKGHWFALPEDVERNAAMRLDVGLFPSLTWESDPLEVTVIIKPKKKSSTE